MKKVIGAFSIGAIILSTAFYVAAETDAAALSVGMKIIVNQPVKVRSSPAITSKNVVGQQRKGQLGVITGGPVVASGYTWWNVDYAAGVDGWSASNFISQYFKATTTYSINASSTTGGAINPGGKTTVYENADQTFTFTPAAGYKISKVSADGVSQGSVSAYTFSNVTANHTIAVEFAFEDTQNPAPTVSISASPSSITAGQASTITWSSTNATSCLAGSGWSGTKATSGTQVVSPAQTATFILECTGAGGSTAASTVVNVTSNPDPSGVTLVPGSGWTGPTAQPAAVGTGPGVDANTIAHWDTVPFQTVSSKLNVAVVAFHINNIDRVAFSVNNGPWTNVYQPSLNPETSVVEYWATLDASKFSFDGSVEVRAIAYPKVGIPRVLQGVTAMTSGSSLLASVNPKGSLPNNVRYASKTGNDANDCTTEAKACLTVNRALETASTAGMGSYVDGAEIRLGEGDWLLPVLTGNPSWQPAFNTKDRWLTFTSAPSANPSKVFITGINGCCDSPGVWLKQVRYANLTVVGFVGLTPGPWEDYIWFDKADMYYRDPDALVKNICDSGFHGYDAWTGVFYTDITQHNVCNPPRGATLVRNIYVEDSAAGHTSGSKTVINYTAKTIYGSGYKFPGGTGPDYHGDLYFMYANPGDVILYGIKTVPGAFRSTRGIVTNPGSLTKDVAFVDINIDTGPVGWVFSSCSPIDNMLVKNGIFKGPSSPWCGEGGGGSFDATKMKNVVIENSQFINGTADSKIYPLNVPGVTWRTSSALPKVSGTPAASILASVTSLKQGDAGDAVIALQDFLKGLGLFDEESTGYFGSLTSSAVKSFQEKNAGAILAPNNLTAGTGFVGQSTINFIKSLLNIQD